MGREIDGKTSEGCVASNGLRHLLIIRREFGGVVEQEGSCSTPSISPSFSGKKEGQWGANSQVALFGNSYSARKRRYEQNSPSSTVT